VGAGAARKLASSVAAGNMPLAFSSVVSPPLPAAGQRRLTEAESYPQRTSQNPCSGAELTHMLMQEALML
jgi:hypothetical protein